MTDNQSSTGAVAVTFSCNINGEATPFPHFWEHTVGSCHATMALRADWQQQLTRCHRELGFRHVRFHGLLGDDMGTLMNEMDAYVYSFFNADQICDFLLSIGMRPFMELSFMPSALSSGGNIVFHYKGNITPPRSYEEWATLITKLVGHWVERYGVAEVKEWFFEVWNEPNLGAFWTGTQAEYFRLYAATAKAIKDIDATLKVGGPATADNEWIDDFTHYCTVNSVPFDFITTHHYPTDSFGQPGDDTIAQLAASRRSALRDETRVVKQQAGDKPVYYTEWSTSSNPFDELHDMPYAAAFIAKTVMEARGLVEGYSYWTFSDIFEENYFNSTAFHGGFGLMNIYGVPKASYRAFELLHRLGNELMKVEGTHDTADAWVARSGNKIQVLITNWALPRHDIKTEAITIALQGTGEIKTACVERVDETNANAYKAWIDMGRPGSLLPAQLAALEEASQLVKAPVDTAYNNGTLTMTVAVPPQGIACITLEL